MFQRLYAAINPFPDETPSNQLTRVVEIFTATWSATPINTIFDPLAELAQGSPWIQPMIGNFSGMSPTYGMYRYLRTDIRLIVKLNSTPYHQGTMYVAWIPYNVTTTLLASPYVYNLDIVTLSACTQDQATIDIPYCSPYPHIDLTDYGGQWLCKIGTLNPLLTSSPSVSDSVSVTVYAQLVNPSLYGPIGASPWPKNKPPGASSIPKYSTQSSDKNKFKPRKEAQEKDMLGISAQVAGAVVEPIIRSVPFLGPVLDIGKALFSSLDKPTSDSAVQYTQNRLMRSSNLLTGIDTSEPLTSLPQAAVAKDVGMQTSDMLVTDYCALPGYFHTYTITTAGLVARIPSHPQQFLTTDPDYLAFASSMYTYFRGSIKYYFQFVGTAFYSLRVRISIVYAPNPASTTIPDPTPYTSKVIDVKGDTSTTLTVPFLTPQAWLPTSVASTFNTSLPYIYIESLTPVLGSSSPGTALYYLNIWRSAGSDFQLAQLRTSQIKSNNVNVPTYEQQVSIRNKFKEPFESTVPGITGTMETGTFMADTSTTITDACHRYVQTIFYNSFSPHYTYPGETSPSYTSQPFHFWSFGFAFWRGSRRYKLFSPSGLLHLYLTDGWNQTCSQSYGSGAVIGDSGTLAMAQAECPYYSTGAFYGTPAIASPTTNAANFPQPADILPSSVSALTQLVAAGDDFIFMFPVPFQTAALPTITNPPPTFTTSPSEKPATLSAQIRKKARD